MSPALTPQLRREIERIRQICLDAGLDPYEVDFELVDSHTLNGVASLDGFPTRYPHWKFGMEFQRMHEMHRHGLMHIYEAIINTNHSIAYLRTTNTLTQNRLVIAHCYAHSDFFKNNMYFSHTNRNMLDEMASHRSKILRHEDKHGIDAVEKFLDACLSLENLIDPHLPVMAKDLRVRDPREKSSAEPVEVARIPSKNYMDPFINPEDYRKEMRKQMEAEQEKMLDKFPPEPTRDVLGFLLQWAPLEQWQRDILAIVRDESYYFLPQRQTKILNEGWASYWHSKLMAEKIATEEDLIEFADVHAGVVAAGRGQLNPYRMGLYLLRDINERWDKGRFGKEWEECDDRRLRESWDRQALQGKEKLFEVRRVCSDVRFIDDYLTPDMVMNLKLYNWEHDKKTGYYYIDTREYKAVKDRLLLQLTNSGEPVIRIENGDHNKRGELHLRHEFTGPPLKGNEAEDTVKNLVTIWNRPVSLDTVREGKPIRVYGTKDEIKVGGRSATQDEERIINEMQGK